MRTTLMAVLAVSFIACGGDDGGPAQADAGPPDGSAVPACHVLFLNFGGATVHAGPDDATTDTSQIVTGDATLAAFSGDATRQAALVDQVKGVLDPFAIDVVTTRPASGDYQMIIIGGQPQDIGLQAGVQSVVNQRCAVNPRGVGFAFNQPQEGDVWIGNQIIAMVGIMNDVRLTTRAGDCMCYGVNDCGPQTSACTIGGAGTPRDTSSDTCDAAADFDELAAFQAALACP